MSGAKATAQGPTRTLAARVAATRFDDVPANAREVVKQALLDVLGVTIAGAHEPLATLLYEEARLDGGNPQAGVIGRGTRVNSPQAALINGAAGHAHDYDDVHSAMSGHPTVPVAPAALALAELLQPDDSRTGRDLVAALAAGIDTECILGRYAGPAHYAAGWHATGTFGTFGAAAACASLLRLDAPATARAFGIAGTRAAGLKSQFGTMCKPLHAGHAAATGLQSARLAKRGFTSREDILETAQGFMDTQAASADEGRFAEAVAQPSHAHEICFKYHASCYLTHSSIEATRNLCARNAFDPNAIEHVTIEVDPGHFRVCNIERPTSGLEAKFSLRFTAAMALAGVDTSSIDAFTDELTRDPAVVRFRDLVEVRAHANRRPESVVTIRTRDGQAFSQALNVAIPLTDLEQQWTRLTAKFHALVDPRFGREAADAIVDVCRVLEAHDDLAPLFSLLTRPAAGPAS
jgi:2-methylcitrate dehydratase PrpD